MNRGTVKIMAVSVFFAAGLVQAGGFREKWVARYNNPEGIGYDEAVAIAIDGYGDIYVTGLSNGSSATVKYDSAGNELWVRWCNIPGVNAEYPTAIAVDITGSIYVTGRGVGSGTGRDYVTVKYNTNGNQLWGARYNGPGNSGDEAMAIAVDGSGNVYVTGFSDSDYATVKYDTNGSQRWVARYNGPGNSDDKATAIAVDSSGGIYVTGFSTGSGTSYDYATIKYDANGNQLWVRRYNGPGNGEDKATAIAVDGSGNIYVTGGSDIWPNDDSDYATIKYDTNGNQLWAARYHDPGYYYSATAIAADACSNICVTGRSYNSMYGDCDYATVKYDTYGNQRWAAGYNGPGNSDDWVQAISVDAFGNVYVTGSSSGPGTSYDYATIKYDTNGSQRWVARYNGSGNGDDWARAIAVDGSGSIYVTGGSYGTGTGLDYDYATIKYSQDCIAPSWCEGADINKDGCVDYDDFAILANHWLEGAGP